MFDDRDTSDRILRRSLPPPQRRWRVRHGKHQLNRLRVPERRRRAVQRYLRDKRRDS